MSARTMLEAMNGAKFWDRVVFQIDNQGYAFCRHCFPAREDRRYTPYHAGNSARDHCCCDSCGRIDPTVRHAGIGPAQDVIQHEPDRAVNAFDLPVGATYIPTFAPLETGVYVDWQATREEYEKHQPWLVVEQGDITPGQGATKAFRWTKLQRAEWR
jgi:hypothetical protein